MFAMSGWHPLWSARLTIVELQQGYFEYCEDMGWHVFSAPDFKSNITDLMLEIHHVSKRHDIRRGTQENVRGFKHVTILGGH